MAGPRNRTDTARLFKAPSPEERSRGVTMRVEPPYSPNVIETAISWLWWAVGAGVSAVIVLIVLGFLFLT